MHKLWAIAVREYKAAVKTKAFVISLVLVPIMWGASIGIQVLIHKAEDHSTKKYAIVDRTADKQLTVVLEAAVKYRNENLVFDEETNEQTKPKYELITIEPSAADTESILQQRYVLSRRCEKGDFEGFLDIGPGVYDLDASHKEGPVDSKRELRYQSAKPGSGGFGGWAEGVANDGILQHRLAADNISLEKVKKYQHQPAKLKSKGLTGKDPVTGEIRDATEESRVATFVLPAILIVLMYFMILVGASPAMQGVVEEKQQRISEVLLGSVSPFTLMLGKLLGVVAVAMTVGAIYATVGYALASRYGLTESLSPSLLAWFFLFLALAVLTYASLFIAVGAAANDIKETQSLLMPVMLVAATPMLLLGAVLQDPNGIVAMIGSFFPFTAPMIMTARISVPPGVAWWQPLCAIGLVVPTVLACVWAASRIFRVGLLMQGKGVKLHDLARWVIRG
jgi:ABC-2 type transport system permease protein